MMLGDHNNDGFALREFFLATNGKNWWRKNGWASNTNIRGVTSDNGPVIPQDWHGVTAGHAGYVVAIRLPSNNLRNPPRLSLRHSSFSMLGGVSQLTYLDLSHNQISGGIPTVFGQLEFLEELYLNYNRFSGEIPTELGRMLRLKRLRLSNNRLSGLIPVELKNLRSLEQLDCDNNHLSDTLDVWGCVGTVVTQEEDAYPTRMYLFLLDAPPINGTGSCASEAEATARAEAWIQWHLNQLSQHENQSEYQGHVDEVRVQRVAIPQNYNAQVYFKVASSYGGKPRNILAKGKFTWPTYGTPFDFYRRTIPATTVQRPLPTIPGKMVPIPDSTTVTVFGAVQTHGGSTTAESKIDDFPHRVIHINDSAIRRTGNLSNSTTNLDEDDYAGDSSSSNCELGNRVESSSVTASDGRANARTRPAGLRRGWCRIPRCHPTMAHTTNPRDRSAPRSFSPSVSLVLKGGDIPVDAWERYARREHRFPIFRSMVRSWGASVPRFLSLVQFFFAFIFIVAPAAFILSWLMDVTPWIRSVSASVLVLLFFVSIVRYIVVSDSRERSPSSTRMISYAALLSAAVILLSWTTSLAARLVLVGFVFFFVAPYVAFVAVAVAVVLPLYLCWEILTCITKSFGCGPDTLPPIVLQIEAADERSDSVVSLRF